MKIKNKCNIVIFSFFLLFLLLVIMVNKSIETKNPNLMNEENFTFEVHKEESRLSSGRNIFFLETSHFNKTGSAKLNCRQACAVESAARANPSMSVNLFFFNTVSFTDRAQKFVNLLRSHYENLQVKHVMIDEYIKNSPIEKWYKSGVINTSMWPVSHMSDIMRFFTLWKFGGIYLDLDVVVIKSLESLTNFAGAQDSAEIAVGAFGFSPRNLGRWLADTCLKDLMENFNGHLWSNNGVSILTRTIKKLCGNVNKIEDMKPECCDGFCVFSPAAFYPIYYSTWRDYFNENPSKETMKKIEQAWAIHVWNKLSAETYLNHTSTAPYARIAQKQCPWIYNNCPVF